MEILVAIYFCLKTSQSGISHPRCNLRVAIKTNHTNIRKICLSCKLAQDLLADNLLA